MLHVGDIYFVALLHTQAEDESCEHGAAELLYLCPVGTADILHLFPCHLPIVGEDGSKGLFEQRFASFQLALFVRTLNHTSGESYREEDYHE